MILDLTPGAPEAGKQRRAVFRFTMSNSKN